MLPSKSLYGNDKKPPSNNDNENIENHPPPPPYSEYSSSGYGSGYHERTPTAPPASLLRAPEDGPSHYPMPTPHTNPAYPTYGAVDASARHVPDADDYTDNNAAPNSIQQQQQPLLPPSPTPQASQRLQTMYKKPFKIICNWYRKNYYINYIKTHWTKKGILLAFVSLFFLIAIAARDDDGIRSPPTDRRHPTKVVMTSPYPLSPFHKTYANNDTKEMTDLPRSTLSTLAVDFTSHTGELHLVPTDDPVSWLSFSSSEGYTIGPPSNSFLLDTDFTVPNASSLQVVIHRSPSQGRLIAVLHVSPNDRQHARLKIKVDTMMVYAITKDPADMIQDLDVTLKGVWLQLRLPEGRGWKGKNLRVKLEGNNGSFGVSRLEASGTIALELTGMAGGDLILQEAIVAKTIKLTSRNGSIVMTNKPGATMTADTIELTTTNSKILVPSIQARHACTLRTKNGNIDVTLQHSTPAMDLDRLDVQSENSAIHVTTKMLIKRSSITSNLGSITMHATQAFDGLFDIQSSLSKADIEDSQPEQIKLDVDGKSIKQGRRGRGTREHQIKLFSYAGSSRLVFNQ
ncbi:hypothetical protein BCR42DRAFT_428327 [Absidia repens]|uniref:DUF4097 domain-containing protein n=1 Tax=Absidia repens TaxID=90262 RepID=A0A1X2HYK7_9FUNG|nr:hypothetical protein BCR42DRAFT_428327 [Absidia repens]